MSLTSQLNSSLLRRRGRPITNQKVLHLTRTLAPTFMVLTFATVAHAQGTMDFSGAQTLMGTFKTSTLTVIRQGAEQNGYSVEGFAPTSRAAHQLRDAGITADTLQGFLARARNQTDPSQKHLYMVDETVSRIDGADA